MLFTLKNWWTKLKIKMQPDKDQSIKVLVKFFANAENFRFEYFNGSVLTVKVLDIDSNAKAMFASIFKDVTELSSSLFEIKISTVHDGSLHVFYDKQDFINKYENDSKGNRDKQILILHNENGVLVKYKNEDFCTEKALLFNYPVYRELLSYLISQNAFTPYHDNLNRQLVIISKESGAFYIGYDISEARVQDLDNLEPTFNSLKDFFTKKEFIQFFKEVVITSTYKNDVQNRFFELVKNLKVILNVTERDYENYILDFAFDKIKTKFKEERNKYFESLEKGIDSVSKQVISFPLTFAATAFASYQVKDKSFILALIVLAYFLYTIIANKVLQFVKYNVNCLVDDVDREEGEIRNSYNKLYIDFQGDFIKIRTKIKKLNIIILYLKIVLWGLLLLFIAYSSYQIASLNQDAIAQEQLIKIPTSNIKLIITKTDKLKQVSLFDSLSINKSVKDTINLK